MTEIKRYAIPIGAYVYTEAGGKFILASDIDAEALECAINALTAVAMFDRRNERPKQAITHLSALLAAVRKQ